MNWKNNSYPSGDAVMQGGGQPLDAVTANRVLRNTYMLLAMTLIFSGIMAGVSMSLNWPSLGLWTIAIYFGLLFAVEKCKNSAMGIVMVFALTGFLGTTLGPILNHFLSTSGGSQIVMMALGGTGLIFLAMSGIALTTKRDFSFMGSFLCVGLLVAFLAGIAAVVFQMSVLSLVVSAAFLLLSSGLILYQTSEIIHGGETNYISATVTLYISIYNIFVSLLRLLSFFSGDD